MRALIMTLQNNNLNWRNEMNEKRTEGLCRCSLMSVASHLFYSFLTLDFFGTRTSQYKKTAPAVLKMM